jgi:hypothetical protein
MDLITLQRPPLTEPDELADLRDLSPRSVHRWALARGWSAEEAGNWAAWCSGLPVVDGEREPTSAWSLRSIEHLMFTRYLAETGQIGGPEE